MPRYSSQFPDPVALVTVATAKKSNVMTVGWTSPVSSDPPVLMISIAPERFTHNLILEAGEFGVSILADDQRDLSTLAGTLSGASVEKLKRPEFQTVPAEMIRAPLISGARACFECSLLQSIDVGDHTVFFGEVLKATVNDRKSPLILFYRSYYGLGKEIGTYP